MTTRDIQIVGHEIVSIQGRHIEGSCAQAGTAGRAVRLTMQELGVVEPDYLELGKGANEYSSKGL